MNVGILLAAGNSSRFTSKEPKQLHEFNGKSLVSHSGDIMNEVLDGLVVVTNSTCYGRMCELFPDAIVLINDIDNRLESIKTALDHVKASKIVIHDAARPFITKEHISSLLSYSNAQYYLRLFGLAVRTESGYETVDRDKYIDLCTPQIAEYGLFNYLFKEFIYTGRECEILPLSHKLGFKYDLIEGSQKHLRKVTYMSDL